MSTPTGRRVGILRVLTLGFVALHIWHGVKQGGGGWNARHGGLWGAIKAFFVESARDPVLSAGASDFAVVATVLGVTLTRSLPEDERWTWRTKLLLAIYTLFPGLGALLFFSWLEPGARRRAGAVTAA